MSASVPVLVRFLKVVARLALPAADQLRYLRDLGVGENVDELALEFGEGFPSYSSLCKLDGFLLLWPIGFDYLTSVWLR